MILEDRCIGCEICANQCPWGNITMADATGRSGGVLGRLYASIREAFQLVRGAGGAGGAGRDTATPNRITAKAVKCDLCRGYDGRPACVAACPYDAIDYVDPNAYLQYTLGA